MANKPQATPKEMRAAVAWLFGEIPTNVAAKALGAEEKEQTSQTFYKLARVLREAARAGLMRKVEA